MSHVRITPDMLVEKALETLGTPYHHAGRVSGLDGGMDCAGLIIWTVTQLGLEFPDNTAYGTQGLLELMLPQFQHYCEEVPIESIRRGDFLVFCSRRLPYHVGIYTGPSEHSMIHIWSGHNGCQNMRLNQGWLNQIHSAYRLRSEFGYVQEI